MLRKGCFVVTTRRFLPHSLRPSSASAVLSQPPLGLAGSGVGDERYPTQSSASHSPPTSSSSLSHRYLAAAAAPQAVPSECRSLMTKSKRAQLAAAVAAAERTLSADSPTGDAFIHSQRVQQLRAEEALLAASLKRLKAERALATAQHVCDTELNTLREGVAAREEVVADLIRDGLSKKLAVASGQDSPGSSHQVSMAPLALDMTVTHDAEAAVAEIRQGKRFRPPTASRRVRQQKKPTTTTKAKQRAQRPRSQRQ